MMKKMRITAIVCGTVLYGAALLIFSCRFQTPAAPYWDVPFDLPLFSERFVMSELADEIKELSVDGEQMRLSLKEDLDTFEVGDRLRSGEVVKSVSVSANGSLLDSLEIPGDIVVVDTAVIKQGSVSIRFENQSAAAVDVDLRLDDIKSGAGSIFELNTTLPGGAGQTVTVQRDLAGYQIVPPVRDGTNFMRFYVALSGGETVNVEVRISDLVFSSISGIVNELEVPLEDVELDLDIPDVLKDLEIESVDLRLAVDAGVAFPLILDFRLQGTETDDGQLYEIAVHDTVRPVPGEMSSIVVPGAADFFNAHPERISISGRVLIGDGVTRSRIDEHHVIRAAGYLDMPLTLKLPLYTTKTDPDTMEIDEEMRDVLRDNIISAGLLADIENALPVGVSLRLVFSASVSDSTIYDPGNADLTLTAGFAAAPNDGGSPAVVNGTTAGTMEIDLSSEKLDLFRNNPLLYWGMEIEFPGTARMVRFRPRDYIDVTARFSALLSTKQVADTDSEGGDR